MKARYFIARTLDLREYQIRDSWNNALADVQPPSLIPNKRRMRLDRD